jgi:hypothetical protein
MTSRITIVATILLLGVAGTALVNTWAVVRRVPPPSRVDSRFARDTVMRLEARLATVRASMERRKLRGKVGYLADLPPAELAADPGAMRDYFVSQFVLAPVVLEAQAESAAWIVANLRTHSIEARMPPGFRVAEDCGDGVWLLERSAR